MQTFFMENFKFVLFVVTPVVSASFFWNDRIVETVVRNRQYVRFPPEGERPKKRGGGNFAGMKVGGGGEGSLRCAEL